MSTPASSSDPVERGGTAPSDETLIETQRLAALGRQTAAIIHDIRNPLHILGIMLDAIARRADGDATIQEAIANARTSVERITRIVGSMLNLAHPATGRRVLDVRSVAEEAIGFVSPTVRGKDITFQRDFQGTTPPLIEGDPTELQQALVNLLLNAVDAITTQGVVTVRIAPAETTVRLEVTDTGQGIPPEHLDDVLRASFTTREGGMGLGLTITRTLIERTGGTIEVASTPGSGTTFTILLPRLR